MRPAISRWVGGLRIGAGFFPAPGPGAGARTARGVVDRMSDLANPGVDPTRVHPDVVRFFEDTAGLDLHIRSRWRFPFSLVWLVGRWAMRTIGQFVLPPLPRGEARITTRSFPLDPALDGRADARAIVRTYAGTDDVMQAIAYATWERAGTRYMSAAFPMPGGQLAGFLRLDPVGEDGDGKLSVVLTSAARDGDDAGVWFVVGRWAFRSPFGERLELWAPGTPGAPTEPAPDGIPRPTILGRHEQRFFGVRFVTHHYWFWPTPTPPEPAEGRHPGWLGRSPKTPTPSPPASGPSSGDRAPRSRR